MSIENQSFVGVPQNRCSRKFLTIHRKTPVPECILKKDAGRLAILLQRDPTTGVFLIKL